MKIINQSHLNSNLEKQKNESKKSMDYAEDIIDMIAAKHSTYKNQNHDTLVEMWSTIVHKLTYEQIRLGCEWLIKFDVKYVSNIMRGFKLACFGLENPETAYQIAKKIKSGELEKSEHIEIYHAMEKSGIFNLRSRSSEVDERKYFFSTYDYVCDQVMLGVQFSAPKPAVASNVSGTELNKRYRSRLAANYGHDSKQVKDFDMFCKMSPEENRECIKNMLKSKGILNKIKIKA